MPRARHAKRMRSRSARRSIKRRRSTRRRMPRKNIVRAPRTVSFAPLYQEKVRTWLTYVDTKTIAPDTGAAKHVFRLNSIYDPDQDGVGHQPAFHDQWADFYSKYRVLGCKYKITFRTGMQDSDVTDQAHDVVTASGTYPVALKQDWRERHICFAEVADDNTFVFTQATDLNFLRETGRKMSGVTWKYGPSRRGTTISGYVPMKQVFKNPNRYDDETSFGANPSSVIGLAVGAMSKSGDETNAIGFDITLKYLVEFTSQIDVGTS